MSKSKRNRNEMTETDTEGIIKLLERYPQLNFIVNNDGILFWFAIRCESVSVGADPNKWVEIKSHVEHSPQFELLNPWTFRCGATDMLSYLKTACSTQICYRIEDLEK